MPVLRAVPVPGHDYGARSLTYGVVVLMPLPVPQSVDGVATSTTVNTLLLKVGNPAVYTVHYHLSSGSMRISVAAADAPGQIVLDRQPVSSKYDAATGLLSYAPPRPLAAGIHIVEVAGADGTLASRHATFWVLPSSMENFTGQMIEDQTASDMTEESIQFSDYMNSEYGDGSDIWQPTFYGP